MQFFSDPKKEIDKWSLPDCECFYLSGKQIAALWHKADCDDCNNNGGGYFWWFCFPGCMPESEAYGPYESEQEAIDDCRSEFGEPYQEAEYA